MRKGMNLLRTGGLLMVAVMVLLFAAGAADVNGIAPRIGQMEGGADLIVIDTMKSMGPLERPPVPFFHSRHTEALAKIGRDCSACHMGDDKGRLSLQYKRLESTDRQKVTDTYHINCISCHRELAQTKQKSGPQHCGGCHQKEPSVVSTGSDIPFDKSLHYRHVKATGEKCESCHHEYDKKTEKLIYTKGNEGACVYCHKETVVDNVMAAKEAAHHQCIGCHRERVAKNQPGGPSDCLSCHDTEHRAGIEVIPDVPRLQRNQPDAVLVKTGDEDLPQDQRPATMNPVPFAHQAHEKYNESCKVCHHASLESCSQCHTNEGKKEGDNVKLAQAMHRATSPTSCIGCHKEKQQAAECAGCHTFLGKSDKPGLQSCSACHEAPLATRVNTADAKRSAKIASDLLRKRDKSTKIYPVNQIPEKVTIGRLSDRFEPADFPHGKIVKALIAKTGESKLAGYFHTDQGTLCQGCHHNSPPTAKPPVCSSCHGKTVENADAFRPGLVGAYHQQCIGCHTAMGMEKPASTDCNACHVEKKKG